MWSYYGSKSKVVDFYPPPKYGKIIEPFAGSAKYSLKFFDRDILLVDKYEVVVNLWHYLQSVTPAEIMALPEPVYNQSLDDFKTLAKIEKQLLGFMVSRGNAVPKKTVKTFSDVHSSKKQIASQLFKIKHWKIILGSYLDIIDPPYQEGGQEYKFGNKHLNFQELASWCKSRSGHVIVCENTKATWLPFKPMKEMTGITSTTTEAIWSNFETAYDTQQLSLFGMSATNTARSGLAGAVALEDEVLSPANR
jgi:16S rRNA G966 N2-methylase RsmD